MKKSHEESYTWAFAGGGVENRVVPPQSGSEAI